MSKDTGIFCRFGGVWTTDLKPSKEQPTGFCELETTSDICPGCRRWSIKDAIRTIMDALRFEGPQSIQPRPDWINMEQTIADISIDPKYPRIGVHQCTPLNRWG